MVIEIPGDWPVRRWHEDTPLGHLETVATDAASGAVPKRWEVASWESTREIASSALPGQIRHKTGLSVGTGKALVKRDSSDYPWRQRDVYALTGSAAQILIAPEGATEIPTGQFRVAPTEGDITTVGVEVDLDERQIQGRDKAANVLGDQWTSALSFEDGIADPAWLVSELARQMGFGVTAEPNQDGYVPMLDVPLQGSLSPAWPRGIDFRMQSGTPQWGEFDGLISLFSPDEPTTVQYARYALIQPMSTLMTLTFDAYDRAEFQWIRSDQTVNGTLNLTVLNRTMANPDEFQVTMSSRGLNGTMNASTGPVTYTYPIPEDRPSGIQVQVELTPSASGNNWNSARFRARRGAGSAWSAWSAVHTITNPVSPQDTDFNFWLRPNDLNEAAHLARVSVVDSANPVGTWTEDQLWAAQSPNQQGRLYLEPLFGTIRSPWLDPDLTVLNAMQAVVQAWQGALITDVYGDLHLLNRFSLSGVSTGTEPLLDVGLNFEDLPWVMDYSDQADRLVVKYRPARIVAASPAATALPTLWETSDLITVPGNSTVSVFFSLDYIYPLDLLLVPFVRKGLTGQAVAHTWDAHPNSDGTGASADPDTDMSLQLQRVTSATWKIEITNHTGSTLYMVDETGTPYLKIRSSYYLDQTQEATVERGLASGDAQNALEVDLSNYVQNDEDANTLADFLWARVNRRVWRAKTVRSVPDYSIDLGDIREIVHSRTQVRSNVLVSKVKLAGEPGAVTQELDLILIPPTWEDFDEAWGPEYHTSPPGSWTEFDALWAPYTWQDFDRTPTATTVAEIEEGM